MGRKGYGIEMRDASIRITFQLDGIEYRERITIDGKPLAPTVANKKVAERMARDIRDDIRLGLFTWAKWFPDSPRAKAAATDEADTLGALLDLFIKSCGTLKPSTRDQYETAARFWKRLLGEHTKVKKLTHKKLKAELGGYPWPSAKTHNNYLIVLRGALALEYNGPASVNNPLIGIENMKQMKRLPDPFTVAERDTILADMAEHYDERVHAYFVWQFYTGMRPEETIALRWSDVDFKAQTVKVRRVRTFRGSESDDTKTFVEREVDLMPPALAALHTMKPHTFMGRADRGKDEDTAQDIFQNPITGRPWHDERAQRDTYFRPCLKRLGIRWRRAYNARHTFATAALMAGVAPGYVAHQLGHSPKMLHDKYAKWIPGNDGGAAREMLRAAMGNVNSSQNSSQKNQSSG